jgi:hypothetical protein
MISDFMAYGMAYPLFVFVKCALAVDFTRRRNDDRSLDGFGERIRKILHHLRLCAVSASLDVSEHLGPLFTNALIGVQASAALLSSDLALAPALGVAARSPHFIAHSFLP